MKKAWEQKQAREREQTQECTQEQEQAREWEQAWEQEKVRKGERLRPHNDLSLGRREEVPSGEWRGCEGRCKGVHSLMPDLGRFGW